MSEEKRTTQHPQSAYLFLIGRSVTTWPAGPIYFWASLHVTRIYLTYTTRASHL
jgi:hypothetical protein